MTISRLTMLVDRLCTAASRQDGGALTDADLLMRYQAARDEAAFATLVRRHGPMVLGVCRRVLRDAHDAEDAFQATFLVLIRKADSVRPREALGNWLYGVAYRAALKTREASLRRNARERLVPDLPEPVTVAQGLWNDLLPILDRELAGLPEKYRLPIILCGLEGKSRTQAAKELGWPEGTVAGRLSQGRALLARRLARHGVVVSGGVLAALLSRNVARAAVPAALALAAVKSAGGAALPGAAAELAEAVLKGMGLAKVKVVTIICLALGLMMAGAALFAARPSPPAADKLDREDEKRPDDDAPALARDRYGDPIPPGALARIGTIRWRAGGAIFHGAFSPDGKLLAVGGRSLRLFEVPSGRVVKTLVGHTDRIRFVAFSPDGRSLLSSSDDGTLRQWDVRTGEGRRRVVEDVDSLQQPAFAPDGKLIAVALRNAKGRGFVAFLDPESGKELDRVEADGYRLAFSPDGRFVATGGSHREERPALIDVAKRRKVCDLKTGDDGAVHVAFSPDGHTLLTSAGLFGGRAVREPRATFWSLPRGEVAEGADFTFGEHEPFVGYLSDGKTLITTQSMWDTTIGKKTPIPAEVGIVFAATADGRLLAGDHGYGIEASAMTGCAVSEGRDVVTVWDRVKGKAMAAGDGMMGAPIVIAEQDGGKTLVTLDLKGVRTTWDSQGTQRQRETLDIRTFQWCASPDGRTVFAKDGREKVTLYDLTGRNEPRRLAAPNGWVWPSALSPDGRVLAVVTNPVGEAAWVYLIDTMKDRPISRVEVAGKEDGRIEALAFAPDGKTVAVATIWGTLHLIDVATAKLITLTTGRRDPKIDYHKTIPQQIAIAPNGKTLAYKDVQGAVSVWELASGKRRARQANRPGPVTFSPDGRLLATADDADVIHLWDTATGADRARLTGHDGAITALTFSVDGKRLYSGSNDTTVLTWPVPPARALADTSVEELVRRWEVLKGDDAEKAFAALCDFVAARRTVAFLREKLKPEPPIDARRLEELLSDLGSEDFETRETATRELAASGGKAEHALLGMLGGKPSPEARRRAEELLKSLREARPTGEALRQVRAIEILETIGDRPARELLTELAKGAAGALLTRQARESLSRWPAE
jgi:RNA polymerase sigma factor (sigma-70 family)